MQTFLLIWTVSSVAIVAMVLIVRSTEDLGKPELVKAVLLAAFWPPIFTGLLVSFALWYCRKSIGATHQPDLAP